MYFTASLNDGGKVETHGQIQMQKVEHFCMMVAPCGFKRVLGHFTEAHQGLLGVMAGLTFTETKQIVQKL